ncbi:ATP-binding protein [Calidifontimicrobium sp. SYSU G02091]|uniref:ATP-binding protein n=1 Tax=Calidifontimicrobium sp. SYSU G02091 TaxID=2926421 RepID=UPI001F53C165|nr:ATP-binding protein [Calidifontimicrobium sp. SYSU G02091]MCI1192822.1 ATP-binding protein [Calidifontimicrobium sp. SYSU G02091]
MTLRWRHLAAITVIAVLAVGGGGALWVQSERADDELRTRALDDAAKRGLQVGSAMAGRIDALVGGMDVGLQRVRDAWLAAGGAADAAAAVDAVARSVVDALPRGLAAYLSVVDANGRVVYATVDGALGVDVGDREHFREQQRASDDRLRIGAPMRARLVEGWTFIVNRPLRRGGRFAGTVNLSVDTEGLARELAALQLAPGEIVALVDGHGRLLARTPNQASAVGTVMPADRPFLAPGAAAQGTYRAASRVDDVPRLFAWQRLGDRDLTLVVGLSEDAILAPLDAQRARHRTINATVWALLLLLGAVAAALVRREAGRQAQTQAQLERSHARQALIAELATLPAVADGDVEAVAAFVTERTSAALGTPRAGVWLFDAAARTLVCRDLYTSHTGVHEHGATLDADAVAAEFEWLRRSKVLAAEDALADPRTAAYADLYLRPLGIRALLDVGLWRGDAPAGILCFERFDGPHRWPADDIAFACQVADQLSLALSNERRRRTEDELRRKEAQLAEAQQIARVGSWDLDLSSGRASWSAEEFRLLGHEPGAVEPGVEAFMAAVHPDDRERVAAAMQRAMTPGSDGRYAVEHRVRTPAGERIVDERGQVVFAADGRAERMIGTTTDVTERKRTERLLAAINEAQARFIARAPEGEIFGGLLAATLALTESEYGFIGEVLRAPDGRLTVKAHGLDAAAPLAEARRLLERHAPSDMVFGNLDNLFGRVVTERALVVANDVAHDARAAGTPPEHPPIRHFMGVPLTEGDEVRGLIALANRPGGYDASMLPALQPLMTACVNMFGLLQVERERAQAQAALNALNATLEARVAERTAEAEQARREAERANAAKSDFLSQMSHELRTPLNAVLGFSQLLEMSPLRGDQAAHVREVLRAGRQLLELIDEILDLARVEAGKVRLAPEPVALGALVAECVQMLRPMAQQGDVAVHVAVDPAAVVHADRARLRQVLLNLLTNAVKYNRRGGEVTVDAQCAPAPAAAGGDAGGWEVRVTDTGAGLTEAQIGRLFQPFERLDAARSRVAGTGIGLSVCKRLVELMGGRIGVRSEPGRGSTFWFWMPRADAEAGTEPATAAASAASPPSAAPRGRPRRVLYVEDHPANQRLLADALATRGDIDLAIAGDADAALEAAASAPPDLLLLDIQLPGCDGYELLRRLRAMGCDAPAVAVSANAMPADVARGRAAGFVEYLAKPLDLRQLLDVVEAQLEARRAATA